MGEYAPFMYRCDGTCGRTIGDIGAFLWIHEDNKSYCPACFDLAEEVEE